MYNNQEENVSGENALTVTLVALEVCRAEVREGARTIADLQDAVGRLRDTIIPFVDSIKRGGPASLLLPALEQALTDTKEAH